MPASATARPVRSLQVRLTIAVFGIGIAGALLLFGFQYAAQRRHVLETFSAHMEEIQESHRSSFADTILDEDWEEIRIRLEGLLQVPGVRYAGIHRDGHVIADAGDFGGKNHWVRGVPLYDPASDSPRQVGEFLLVADRAVAEAFLWDHAHPFFLGTLAQIVLVAGALLLLVRRQVGRRLERIAGHLRTSDPRQTAKCSRMRAETYAGGDELDDVVAAIHALHERFLQTLREKEEESARRKAAQEKERIVKERLELALLASDTGTWRWDPASNADTRDANLNRILGLEAAETTQPVEDFIDRIHPDDRPRVEAVLEKAMRDGSLYDVEMRVYRPDNTIRWVRDRGRAYYKEDGAIRCVTGAVADITEMKQAEFSLADALRRETERTDEMQAILDGVPVAVWIAHDPDCTHMVGNRRAHELFRVPMGINASQTAPEGEKLTHFQIEHGGKVLPGKELPMQVVARTGTTVTDYEMDLVFDDGERVTLLGNAVPLRDASGEGTGAVGAFLDITARKAMETDLREAMASLRETNRNLEQFTYIASHDLQEPMRKVSAFCDRLRQRLGDNLDERAAQYLKRLTSASERMRKLIQDLLLFSRASRAETACEAVPLDDVLADVCDLLEITIRDANATIRATPLPVVRGDAPQIRQVLQNLLTNALKFQSSNNVPEVRVSCECNKENAIQNLCRVTVRDNGIGFDPAYAEQIFEPFRRLHARSEYEGSGIGLAICAKVLQRHNGRIEVESAPGEGSAFHLFLPFHTPCASCWKETGAEILLRDGAALPAPAGGE